MTLIICFFLSNKRMEECALIMTEPVGSIALAHHNILVNVVKMIGVNSINAKIMELVLSHS